MERNRKYFFEEINERENMSKVLNKYITAPDCTDKTLLVLSRTSSDLLLIVCVIDGHAAIVSC